MAGQGAHHAAQLDRGGPVAPTWSSPSRPRPGAGRASGHRLHDPTRHPLRGHLLRRRRRLGAGGRAGSRRPARGPGDVRGLSGAGSDHQRDRPAVHRATQDRGLPGAPRCQPGQRRADPDLRGRLRVGRLRPRRDHGEAVHDQRDLDFARAFGLPVRVVVDVRGEDGQSLPIWPSPSRRPPGKACWSTPARWTAWARPRRSSGSSGSWSRRDRGTPPRTTGCATG